MNVTPRSAEVTLHQTQETDTYIGYVCDICSRSSQSVCRHQNKQHSTGKIVPYSLQCDKHSFPIPRFIIDIQCMGSAQNVLEVVTGHLMDYLIGRMDMFIFRRHFPSELKSNHGKSRAKMTSPLANRHPFFLIRSRTRFHILLSCRELREREINCISFRFVVLNRVAAWKRLLYLVHTWWQWIQHSVSRPAFSYVQTSAWLVSKLNDHVISTKFGEEEYRTSQLSIKILIANLLDCVFVLLHRNTQNDIH